MASQPAPKDESIEGEHDLDEEVPETSATGVRARPEGPSRDERRSPAPHFGRVVGTSPAMRRLFPLCERLAKTDVYRLAVARITLPPLRERDGDIIELLRYFWDALGGAAEGGDLVRYFRLVSKLTFRAGRNLGPPGRLHSAPPESIGPGSNVVGPFRS